MEDLKKELKKILKRLEAIGFRITYNDGSRMKIYPPDRTKPFYSLHMGEPGLFPLVRFARKNWGIEL